MDINLLNLEKNIEYVFKNKKHLLSAITHPSYKTSNFQNLEFLGDRLLGSVIANLIYKKKIDIKETAKQYSNLVSTKALSKVATKWEVEKFLYHKIENLSDKLLADVVEAILAAIFLDSNYDIVFKYIKNLYSQILIKEINNNDYKTLLQELTLKKKLGLPTYSLLNESIKNNIKIYTMQVTIGNQKECATAESKPKATKTAAEKLYNKLL